MEQSTVPLNRATLLKRAFFNRDPRIVSKQLLGKILIRKQKSNILGGRIIEVEAYLGADDAAAHAAAGRTARNDVLFGPPGHAYVYFIYGVHYCLNISCLPEGDAGCVLIRALEPIAGIEGMAEARGLHVKHPDLSSPRILRAVASGPGKLCEALQITRTRDNSKDLLSPDSDLIVVDDGYRAKKVITTKRIGITKSAEMPLRYLIARNPFISGKQPAC